MDTAQNMTPKYYGFPTELYRGYVFGVEKLCNILYEYRDLNYEQAAITEECWLSYPIDINYLQYLQAESNNDLIIITARSEGEIVGNVLYYLKPYANVAGSLMATDVGLYVKPKHRKLGVPVKLMEYAENCLKNLGVNFITHGHKGPAGGPDLDKFFTRRGYKPYAVEYVKEIAPLEKSK